MNQKIYDVSFEQITETLTVQQGIGLQIANKVGLVTVDIDSHGLATRTVLITLRDLHNRIDSLEAYKCLVEQERIYAKALESSAMKVVYVSKLIAAIHLSILLNRKPNADIWAEVNKIILMCKKVGAEYDESIKTLNTFDDVANVFTYKPLSDGNEESSDESEENEDLSELWEA